jgi:N-formylglutamate deformylase
LVRRFGAPEKDRHSVQIEVNRKLYMDEKTFELNAGYAPLKASLRSLVDVLRNTDPRQL